jgi:hypothetical protein
MNLNLLTFVQQHWSNGTVGSLGNTKGGHCSDAEVRMKFKVYICKDKGI